MSAGYGQVLVGERFRIGIAQKALNLYLKYPWCLGIISRPPHCPFDGNILAEVGVFDNWTQMDDPMRYREWVSAAERKAGEALAEWELKRFPQLF